MAISFGANVPPPQPKPKEPEPEVEATGPTPPEKKKYPKKAEMPSNLSLLAVPSLDEVLGALTKERGVNFILRGSDVPNCKRFRTGVFEFDLATGGGVPRGRISIIYGPESSGKTNLAFNLIREVQALGLRVVFVDLEGTFDPMWAVEFGFDLDLLTVIKPAYGEEAVDAVEAVLRTGDIGLVVVDSIAVVVPAKEIEKSTEVADVGSGAILMKRLVMKAAMALSFAGRQGRFPALVLLNQTRFKIGVMYGDPEIFPGGQAVKFLSSLTVRLSATNEMDPKVDPSKPVWKKTTVNIKKAKIAVNQVKSEYSMAMVQAPDYGLTVGQTYSWNTVLNILRTEGKLEKLSSGKYIIHNQPHKPGKWPMEWAKLGNIEEQYLCDPDFTVLLQTMAIATFDGKATLVEAHDAAK